MLKITGSPDKPTLDRNNGSKSASIRNNDNKPASEKNNSNGNVNRFGDDDIKHVKK